VHRCGREPLSSPPSRAGADLNTRARARTHTHSPCTRQALLRALLPEGVDNLLFSPEKKGEDNSGLKLVPGIAERVRGRCVRACVRACVRCSGHGSPPRHMGPAPWQVLEESDTDGDGLLNFEEFSHAVAHSDIRAKLTIVF
tara:strand:- start:54 stop:479 length:426 start_codon:yes stop_codon:yes gene_type:complete